MAALPILKAEGIKKKGTLKSSLDRPGGAMFSGFIVEMGKVISVTSNKLVIGATDKILNGVVLGSSIAVNGVCTTVTEFNSKYFSVDVMPETRKRSNLRLLRCGDEINLERPLTLEAAIECHLVQGHIDATGTIASVTRDEESLILTIKAPPEVMRYIVEKGFITVDGVSLTTIERDNDSFSTAVVSHSQTCTTLGRCKSGDIVNLEVDMIAKYLYQFTKKENEGITMDFLQEHGFLLS
jgi:riboflavin synthase